MNEPYLERRLQSIERQQERHSEEISAMRAIQASQQTLMATFASQRTEDRQEAANDRKALVVLQANANKLRGMLLLAIVASPFFAAAFQIGLRWMLFGHPLSDGTGLLSK